MYTVILSSRRKNNPDCKIENLLDSFDRNSNNTEKRQTEFLIKTDTDDDDHTRDLKFFADSKGYGFAVKIFTWDRHGGRHSLHEVQHYLYRYINEKTQWIQVIADDFEFKRSGFVSEILNIPNAYAILNRSEGKWGRRGYAPCFSRKLLDACSFFTPHSNCDGFAYDIAEGLRDDYDIDIMISSVADYYERMIYNTTNEDMDSDFRKMATHYNVRSVNSSVRKNIYLNMKFEGLI